jgi:hypothetical protein
MRELSRYVEKNWIWISAGLILTKKAVEYSYRRRGGFYIGGEWFILPLILMFAYLISSMCKEVPKLLGEEEENAGQTMESRGRMEKQRSSRYRRDGR